MSIALSAKTKEGFIDGTIKKPGGAPLQNFNVGLAAMILSNHGFLTPFSKISGRVWSTTILLEWFERAFSHVNSTHLFIIEQEIHGCIQGKMNIGAYYSKLKGLWDECDALCCIPTVQVGLWRKCCSFSKANRPWNSSWVLMMPTQGSGDKSCLWIAFLQLTKPSLIIQDEKEIAVSTHAPGKASIANATTFAVQDNSRNYGRNFTPKNPHLNCDRCNTIGHISNATIIGWKAILLTSSAS